MKRLLVVGFFLVAVLVLSIMPAQAAEGSPTSVLCLPDIYMLEAIDCLPAGPSAYLTEMARQGNYLSSGPAVNHASRSILYLGRLSLWPGAHDQCACIWLC